MDRQDRGLLPRPIDDVERQLAEGDEAVLGGVRPGAIWFVRRVSDTGGSVCNSCRRIRW